MLQKYYHSAYNIQIRDKNSRLRNHLPEVIPDQDLIEQKENEVKETIYHTEFSKGSSI